MGFVSYVPNILIFAHNVTSIPNLMKMKRDKTGELNSLDRAMTHPLSLYIHIPFCTTKCYYCAFNTYAFHKEQAQSYLNALSTEMALYAHSSPPLKTIFFGGGTPSILSAATLDCLFAELQSLFQICPDAEITVECNPGTVNREKLQIMHSAGINRLSFGVQAMDDAILRQIGRIHKVSDVVQSYQLARETGFDNINLDLIFALPNQTIAQWKSSLQAVIAFQPEHISTYNLVLEEGTAFYEWRQAKKLKLPPNELEADMYELAIEMLTYVGYEHYEISNFVKPSHEARHNLVYWNNEPCMGLGVSAWGYLNGVRYSNIRSLTDYVDCLAQYKKPIAYSERFTGRDEKAETVMLGLRKREGIQCNNYQRRFGEPIDAEFGEVIEKWTNLKLLEWKNGSLRLTGQGLMLANEVFMDFL